MKSLNYAVISSLCALIIGILLVVWPDAAVNYLVITIGVLFLLPGLAGMFAYFHAIRKGGMTGGTLQPVIALGSSLLGLWLMVMPGFFIKSLMYLLGVLLVLGGLNQLAGFISVRRDLKVPAVCYVIPALVLVAGIVILANPFEAATIPFIILGVSAIVYALTDLLRILRFRIHRGQVAEDVRIIEEVKEE